MKFVKTKKHRGITYNLYDLSVYDLPKSKDYFIAIPRSIVFKEANPLNKYLCNKYGKFLYCNKTDKKPYGSFSGLLSLIKSNDVRFLFWL